jgi:RNA polymerase sigma factor (sigma-70 family)
MSISSVDLDMIAAARGGDQPSILALLEKSQPDIRRYARLSCSNADDVDDAVQETLWLLYRRVGTIKALTSFSGWLLAVVRRECLRLARRATGGLAAANDKSAHQISVDDIDNDLRFSYRPQTELRIDLSRAIASLPEHYREVILLRDIEEMTVDEIARTLTLTRESTKARLHRARGLLREYLRDE